MDTTKEQWFKIQNVPRGEFVKRKPESKKVYRKEFYCRFDKRYVLQDMDDISRTFGMKKDTLVWIGFTY